jgi:PAS domain S-box-containing protein
MRSFDHGSWTTPDPSGHPLPETALGPEAARRRRDAPAADAVGFLFAGGDDPRRDTRRITSGLVALAVVLTILLNVGIYQSSGNALRKRRWQELEHATEYKRTELRERFGIFERQARHVAEYPALADWSRQAMAGTLEVGEQQALEHELERARRDFGMRHLVLVSPEGVMLARTGGAEHFEPARHAELIQAAGASRGNAVADLHTESDGSRTLEMAQPLVAAASAGRVPVLIAANDATEALSPILTRWRDLGPGAHAYLVRRQGAEVLHLTSPHPDVAAVPTAGVDITGEEVRAAAMAATGIESNVEFRDDRGRMVCATTRFLPELGWGVVGQMDRRALLLGIRGVVARLLLVDLLLGLCAMSTMWLWRRQYSRGLARHEVRVTHRHAARVQAIFDTAFDAIVSFDQDGHVRTVNRAAERLFGRDAAELEDQPLQRFLRWEGAPGSLPAAGVVGVAEALRADGEVFPAELSLGQVGEGAELLYTAIIRDIRERVEAEQRIRTFADGLEASNRRLEEVNAQLEEASRLKSEFLANTSHELRTPLNGMMGFLQLVLDGMCESREEEQDFLRQALQCSRHLLGLINDVLDIAKIESGKLTLEIEPVVVETLFNEVHTLTHVQAAQKGITLTFAAPEEPELAVRADSDKVKQVLVNLVGNSLKFTHHGSVTVRAILRRELGHVRFEVEDTGIGISPDQQRVIFDKFAQGDGGTTRRYGGTGLGLAISRCLVEVMGGIIGAHSEGPGRGTLMYFSLPLWDGAAGTVQPQDEHLETIEGPAAGALVLLVEDDPLFRLFVAALLHQHGYRTVQATSAEAGWLLVRRLRPALVMVDYALACAQGAGLRTGWDLAERMVTESDTRQIPLLFVTGFDGELRQKIDANASARELQHLVKPIEGAALISRIEALVGSIEGRQVRLLMADDDPASAAFVRKVLPQERFHIELAGNGEECLHILRTQPRGFDLLLLDLVMPGVSGYDVLREMAVAGTAAGLPVLVLTSFPEAQSTDEKRLLERGHVLDVLSKSAVHDNPILLAQMVEWHLHAARAKQPEPQEAA